MQVQKIVRWSGAFNIASVLAFFSIILAPAPDGTALVLTTPRDGWWPKAVAPSDPRSTTPVAPGLGGDVLVGVGLRGLTAAVACMGCRPVKDTVALTPIGLDLDLAKPTSTKNYRPTAVRFIHRRERKHVMPCGDDADGHDRGGDRPPAGGGDQAVARVCRVGE
jgi:hypothetical protein